MVYEIVWIEDGNEIDPLDIGIWKCACVAVLEETVIADGKVVGYDDEIGDIGVGLILQAFF